MGNVFPASFFESNKKSQNVVIFPCVSFIVNSKFPKAKNTAPTQNFQKQRTQRQLQRHEEHSATKW